MPKTRQQKEEIVQQISEGLTSSESTVFVQQDKLTVNAINALRRELFTEQVDLISVKKSLLKIALKNAGLDMVPVDSWERTIAVAVGRGDSVAPARLLQKFAKKNPEQISLLGGFLDGEYMDTEQIRAFAMLPSREELLAKTVFVLKSPISGFANVLAGNLRGLVVSLKAIAEQKA